jgi:hypothetical protein
MIRGERIHSPWKTGVHISDQAKPDRNRETIAKRCEESPAKYRPCRQHLQAVPLVSAGFSAAEKVPRPEPGLVTIHFRYLRNMTMRFRIAIDSGRT